MKKLLIEHIKHVISRTAVQFSSVQFARINVLLSAKHFSTGDHDTVISVIDAVVIEYYVLYVLFTLDVRKHQFR